MSHRYTELRQRSKISARKVQKLASFHIFLRGPYETLGVPNSGCEGLLLFDEREIFRSRPGLGSESTEDC